MNNQVTVSGDGTTKTKQQIVTHSFGLVCAGVDDSDFDMYLYFMNTKLEEDGVVVSELTGFPRIIEKESI